MIGQVKGNLIDISTFRKYPDLQDHEHVYYVLYMDGHAIISKHDNPSSGAMITKYALLTESELWFGHNADIWYEKDEFEELIGKE